MADGALRWIAAGEFLDDSGPGARGAFLLSIGGRFFMEDGAAACEFG